MRKTAILPLCVCTLLGACSYQDISTAVFVSGLGIDQTNEGVCVTAEIASGEDETTVIDANGAGLREALTALEEQTGGHIDWGHTRVVVLPNAGHRAVWIKTLWDGNEVSAEALLMTAASPADVMHVKPILTGGIAETLCNLPGAETDLLRAFNDPSTPLPNVRVSKDEETVEVC